ncbi:MAG: NAD(P)/FAD-dependent oxidoreductase [Chitinophagaceae bacterium]|nr:MAG: NAD(P)/FAD-dependent oxidoreductase [Chitinophagaceae bacterium]
MKVVIVGGGFGGLKLARSLNNKAGFEVVLVDKFNYHQFQPLFYQVATAGLDASNISFPLRKAFQKSKNVRIRLAELREVVPEENKIITDMEEIGYDVLVLATGADTNFFGNKKLEENAFPMKSTVEALQLRYRLLQNLETALTVKDEETLARLMNIVVVGGGPTGVEVSGAIAEMKKYILPKEYPELDFSRMNIFLLEGLPKTLANMSQQSSDQSRKYLEQLGVTVMLETMVKDYDGKEAHLNTGKTIPTSTLIWAAGIKGNVPAGIEEDLVVKGNRIKVNRRNQVLGHSNIYAIGDIAFMETPTYAKGHPQVASVAIQQGALLANNLKRIESKSNPDKILDFEYNDKGTMATVGRNLAVVDIPKPRLHLGGFLAWLIWMGLHLVLLLGVKNKFFVFTNWLYNYFTYDQNLRLIFKEFDRTMKSPSSTPKQFKEELVETTH